MDEGTGQSSGRWNVVGSRRQRCEMTDRHSHRSHARLTDDYNDETYGFAADGRSRNSVCLW